MSKHTPLPWTALLSDNGIYALYTKDGTHFANFRNVRGDDAATVKADVALITHALHFKELYEIVVRERDALADAIEAVRGLEPAVVVPLHINECFPAEAFVEGSIHAAQAFRAAIVDAIAAALASKEPGHE